MADIKGYILISIEPTIASFGSFPSMAAARAYALGLQDLGLCVRYSVGGYVQGKYVEMYTSKTDGVPSPRGT